MTERKRPWWMLHWPSWLALIVFGGAFVVSNLLVTNPGGIPILIGGWPRQICEVDIWDLRDDEGWAVFFQSTWLWDVPWISDPEFEWNSANIVVNILVGVGFVAMSVITLERFMQSMSVRLTTRSWFVILGAVGAGLALGRAFELEFLGSIRTCAIVLCSVVIPLRSLFLVLSWLCGEYWIAFHIPIVIGAAIVLLIIWMTIDLPSKFPSFALSLVASLAVLDFIGWLFGRLTKREASS